MDDDQIDEFVTHFVVGNYDPPADEPRQPGCRGMAWAIIFILAGTLLYVLL